MSLLTPLELGRRTIRDWRLPKHFMEFQQFHDELLANHYNRLAISCPVRHGKSWFWGWMVPACYLMNYPERRVAYVSHASLAEEYGYKIRQTIESYGPLFRGVSLKTDSRSKTDFRTNKEGGLTAISAGATISGFGYDLIICDDLQKKQEELDTETQRDKIWRWLYSDLINRLTPNGKVVAIMARRHPDDVMGRIREQSDMADLPPDKRWTFKNYKAISDTGMPLWPSEWPLEKLRATEKDYELAGNSYLSQCLYQGDPMTSPAGLEWHAGLFADIEIDELPKDFMQKAAVISLDPSKGRHTNKGDFAAMGHILLGADGVFYLVDCRLVRQPGPELEDTYIAWAKTHDHDSNIIESDMEGAASMAEMVCRRLRDEHASFDLANKVHSVSVQDISAGDKYERVRKILSILLCQRRIKIVRTGHYRLALSQMRNFGPNSKDHDDACDMLANGVAEITWVQTGRHMGRR